MATDTTSEARRRQFEVWRSMSPSERLELASSMSDEARDVAMAGFARRHPDLDHEQLMREFIQRVHGVDMQAEDHRSAG